VGMEDPLTSLRKSINLIHPIPEEECNSFLSIWSPCEFKRKEIVTTAGETERYLYFVTEGVQRIYYFDDQQREATLVFTYAPSFGGVMDSLLLQKPSRYFYETLTPSSFLKASVNDLFDQMNKSSSIQNLVQQGVTQTLSGLLERMVELQCFSSEEKFKTLLKRSPHILNLVPHKYLANYIGIDSTNFSKLINQVRI
jgi:CRP-like cAMP-binding protein